MPAFFDDIDQALQRHKLSQVVGVQVVILVIIAALLLWRRWDVHGAKIKEG
jgi:hypothetical protein